MKNKIFKICMMALLLTSCSANTSSSSETINIAVKSTNDSKAYISLDYSISLPTTFFTFAEDVPYVKLEDYINVFLKNYENKQNYSVKGNTVTNISNNVSITFDSNKNTISTSDLDQLTNNYGLNVISRDIMDLSSNQYAQFSESDSSYTKGKEITIDMSKYKTKIVAYEGKTYVPYAYLDILFCYENNDRLSFNGNDFYNANSSYMYDQVTGNINEYGEAYYSGKYANMKERSDSYIDYSYYSFLFEMEYTNGKFPGLNISDLDKKLVELGLKSELRSKDSETADTAIAKTIYTVFQDGGHTRFSNMGVTTPYSKEKNEKATKLIASLDKRYPKLISTYNSLKEKRGELSENLTINGETAIIRFDEFDDESETNSTFQLFRKSFDTIEENKNVKNVVFDVTLNGGGASSALCNAISFLTDEPVTYRIKNPVTGAINEEAAKVDNNMDGNFDDKDSYQGKYNFYILTSNFSFSCANAFPIYCQEHNLAKVIGMRSGGGDCSVGSGVSADGTYWNMSSTCMLVRKDNSSYDDGAKVDYELDESYFYDAGKLSTYLSGLTKN